MKNEQMKFFAFISISLLLFSCSNNNSESSVGIIDSLAKQDSVKKVLAKVSQDSIQHIDSIVGEIKRMIVDGKLQKKELSGGMKSPSGGSVYALYENKNSLVYIYSDNGLEFGSSEIDCFFNNDQLIFSTRNRIKFGKNKSNEIDSALRLKTASESTYFSDGKILQQQTETFTTESGWKKIPFQDQLQKIISDIQADLNRHGMWVK